MSPPGRQDAGHRRPPLHEALFAITPPVIEPAAPRRVAEWPRRAAEAMSAWLPLLVMSLLALGSWWLVKNTPLPPAARAAAPLRHVADYTMTAFTVQRFAAGGSLASRLDGDVLRHFPDTDTLEVDNPRVRAVAPNGGLTLASARHAISNADGSQVQLSGDAHVLRQPPPAAPAQRLASDAANGGDSGAGLADAQAQVGPETLEFRGEFLHAFLDTEQLRSHLPVTVRRGGTQLSADTFAYDNLGRVVELKGRVRASFAAASVSGPSPSPPRKPGSSTSSRGSPSPAAAAGEKALR